MMKIRKPNMMANIWSSGKIVCQGARSEEEAKKGARRFVRFRFSRKRSSEEKFKITEIMLQILMDHMDSNRSLESALRFESICSIRIRNKTQLMNDSRFARILYKVDPGKNVRVSNYKVVNVLGNCKLAFAVDIMEFSKVIFRFSKITHFLERILMEHIKRICS